MLCEGLVRKEAKCGWERRVDRKGWLKGHRGWTSGCMGWSGEEERAVRLSALETEGDMSWHETGETES